MITCGGFALGSTALGGSTVKLCADYTPNLIITVAQGLGNIDIYADNNLNLK